MKKLKKEMMGKLANGDDPMEPWSRKSNAPLEERSEQQLLVAYIRSLGYAPEFMTSSQKSAYARSKGFTQYKVSHDFVATNEAYVRKTAAQKIAAALEKQREKNKPYEAHQERMRQLDALKKGMKTEEETGEVNEDLRKWFREKWVRMDTKGNIKGDCAREPGEGKPKCLPQAKAVALGKEGRAKAARRKRSEDPNPERRGAPINVKTESVDPETINEKNVPTSPEKWARAKSAAKSKFSVYPSAYANGWAAKKYKAMGGGWKSVSEEEEISEAGTGLLMTFIRAKGLDPLTMHGNQKASYSRSSEFRLFKRKHRVGEASGMGERGDDWNEASSPAQQAAIAVNMKKKGIKPKHFKEEADKKDTIILDIPLLIRVLELAREDIKTDMDLHRVVERLIDIRTKGMLTMNDYNFIAGLKEEFQIDEMKKIPDNMDADTIGVAREGSICWPGYKRKVGTKKYTPGSCVKEEPVSESNGGRQYKVKSIGYHPKKGDYYISPRSGQPVYKSGVQVGDHENPKTGEIKKKVNEDKYQDPHAATQTVGMEVEGKSRAFKAIKKLTKVNETTYDWEKTEKDNDSAKKQMTAKIIMKGGKTMTGQDRDTIQIDPIVKTKLDNYKSINPNNNK
jgi:hypothetical protein